MERALGTLLLLVRLLPQGRGGPLEVEPREPVVAVALGGSRQLTCRLACAGPRAASVQWRGLDTSLGAVQSGAGSSVLSVRNASLSAAGTRVCVGSCGDLTFQQKVQLLVFAFPDQLTVSPVALVAGQDREVACTAHNVTPADPDALTLSLLLGDQELEGVQALGRDLGEEPQEGEGQLFRVTERWLLPPLGTPAPPTLHCQATMRLPDLELNHRRPIPDPCSEVQCSPTPNSGSPCDPGRGSHPFQLRGGRHGDSDAPSGLGGPPWTPTPLQPTDTHCDHPSGPRLGAVLHSLTSQKPPVTTSPEATLQQGSSHSPRSPDPKPGNSSIGPCRPKIRQSPAPAGLELLCEAACGPGVAVRWTRAPGHLEAYERQEASAQARLSVPWAGCHPEGWFQCRLDPGGQTASLYLVPEVCSPPTSEALWTGSLVLALLLLVFLTYHLWKRCRPAG